MRRLLAIAIVLILGLPAVSPLFALAGGSDPTLPACCRRDGRHHCMAMAATPSASQDDHSTQATTVALTQRCPYGSHSLPGTPHPDRTLALSTARYLATLAHSSVAPQAESKRRISADRSRQKRGPPSPHVA